jgi:hypothetical protein
MFGVRGGKIINALQDVTGDISGILKYQMLDQKTRQVLEQDLVKLKKIIAVSEQIHEIVEKEL